MPAEEKCGMGSLDGAIVTGATRGVPYWGRIPCPASI